MKVDLDYIKETLAYFIESEKPFVSVPELVESVGNKCLDERFIFHYSLLVENNLVSRWDLETGSLSFMGISRHEHGPSYVNTEVRLTQNGHDFSYALNKREVFEKLKSELKDAPFKVIFEGSQKLLQHFAKKKLDNILKED
ncbi:DUF2513 domain-containing protein [Pseudoalteromonas sp. CO342X]|uniref:DUF2513 domain-containing protein n=1 Tax=Pseudoalteromonas TaxID=53246 RepID=UPI00102381EF|nr:MULTISPECIES: DUF2513 domain-containing protein [Pseudoalteromonas]MDP4488900.1 DUF2513 domain-containing protein [Pseudoalteromonas piscicida]RZG14068.1 DUF2513 domain-containing protein [Pseudoalteromonas sp. CO342X]